jgi:hypothetical protein
MLPAHIATARGIAGSNLAKVTFGETRQFLSFCGRRLGSSWGYRVRQTMDGNRTSIGKKNGAVTPAGEVAKCNLTLTTEHSKST